MALSTIFVSLPFAIALPIILLALVFIFGDWGYANNTRHASKIEVHKAIAVAKAKTKKATTSKPTGTQAVAVAKVAIDKPAPAPAPAPAEPVMQDVALAPAPQPQPATVQPEPFEASPEPLTETLHLQDEAFARYNNTLWAGDAVVVDQRPAPQTGASVSPQRNTTEDVVLMIIWCGITLAALFAGFCLRHSPPQMIKKRIRPTGRTRMEYS